MLLLHCSDKGLSATYTVGKLEKNHSTLSKLHQSKGKVLLQKVRCGWMMIYGQFFSCIYRQFKIGKVFQRPNNKMQMEQVKLWLYKLPPAGLAAVRKIQINTTQIKSALRVHPCCARKKPSIPGVLY